MYVYSVLEEAYICYPTAGRQMNGQHISPPAINWHASRHTMRARVRTMCTEPAVLYWPRYYRIVVRTSNNIKFNGEMSQVIQEIKCFCI